MDIGRGNEGQLGDDSTAPFTAAGALACCVLRKQHDVSMRGRRVAEEEEGIGLRTERTRTLDGGHSASGGKEMAYLMEPHKQPPVIEDGRGEEGMLLVMTRKDQICRPNR
jgi:hypothetical protein